MSNSTGQATSQAVSASVTTLNTKDLYTKFISTLDNSLVGIANQYRNNIEEYLEKVTPISEVSDRRELEDKIGSEDLVNKLIEFKKANKNDTVFQVGASTDASTTESVATAGTENASSTSTSTASESTASTATSQQVASSAAQPQAAPVPFSELNPFMQTALNFFTGVGMGFTDFNKPAQVYDVTPRNSEALGILSKANLAAREQDVNATVSQIASSLGGDTDAWAKAESYAMIPRFISQLNNPALQNIIDMIEPGAGKLVSSVVNMVTGGKGTSAELNSALNTGRYGEAASQDILDTVQEFRDRTTMRKDTNGKDILPKYTIGQVADTAKFLKKNTGFNYEIASGATEAKDRVKYSVDLEANHSDETEAEYRLLRDTYNKQIGEQLVKEFGSSSVDELTGEKAVQFNQRKQALQSKFHESLVYNASMFTKDKDAKEAYTKINKAISKGTRGDTVKHENATERLEKATIDMRLVGQSFNAIASPEERQALLKQADNSIYKAENLAAQHAISMYGSNALKYGDFERAAEDARYLTNAAYWAGLDSKELQEYTAAIYKSFGPKKGELANMAATTSAVTQAALSEMNIPMNADIRLEIAQRSSDAMSDLATNRLIWFMNQELDEGKASPELKSIQQKLKSGENLTQKELNKLTEWERDPGAFLNEMSEATGISQGKIAAATDETQSENLANSLTKKQSVSVGSTRLQVRTNLDNQILYTEEAVKSALGSSTLDISKLGYTGKGAENRFVKDFSLLGANGLDAVAILSGQKEISDKEFEKLGLKGKKLKEFNTRLSAGRERYLETYKQIKEKNPEASESDIQKLTFNALGGTDLSSIDTSVTGETYNAMKKSYRNTDNIATGSVPDNTNSRQNVQETIGDETSGVKLRDELQVGMSALDSGALYGARGLGYWATRGEAISGTYTEGGPEAVREKGDNLAQSYASSPVVQGLNDMTNSIGDALNNLVKAIKEATAKIGSGNDGSKKSIENEAPSTEPIPDSIDLEAESENPTSSPEVSASPETTSTSMSTTTEDSTNETVSFTLASVDAKAAEILGTAIATSIKNASVSTYTTA